MNTAIFGRIVFGASAVLFGAIALMWHDRETWQTMHLLWNLPLGSVVGATLMAAQVVGGLALLHPHFARAASIVLGIVYALFALTCAAGIALAPKAIGSYDSFCEQLSLVCGALAVYATTRATPSPGLARATRIGLGMCAVSFAATQYVYLRETAELVPAWIAPSRMFWAILTTIAFALAALAMLVGRQARPAIALMAGMVLLFGAIVWVPILVAHRQSHFSWSEFALTMLIAGASWMVGEQQQRSA